MAWKLPKLDSVAFARNPLRVVLVELRFNPILRIMDGGGVPDFQELIRTEFPLFEEHQARQLKLEEVVGELAISDLKQFVFRSADAERAISLSPQAVSIETSKYTHHAEFLEDVQLGLGALSRVYAPIHPVRLGMRYVNRIDLDILRKHLRKKTLQWDEVVSKAILPQIPILRLDSQTQLNSQIRSILDPGHLTLRFGRPMSKNVFDLDLDRYLDSRFGIDEVDALLSGFVEDCYGVFTSVIGPATREWLTGGELNADTTS